MTGSNRIEEVDISKGIGMVLVITGHLWCKCLVAEFYLFIPHAVVLYLVWYCL